MYNLKIDYKQHRAETIQKHLEQKGSVKKGYKELQPKKSWIEDLKAAGETAYKRSEIINIATDFYKKLYNGAKKTDILYYDSSTDPELQHYVDPIMSFEIIETIKKLKQDKSPGSHKIIAAQKTQHFILRFINRP